MPHPDSLSAPEQQQSRRPEQKYFRPDIAGLRAVAVLAVVLFHAEIPGVSGGFVGVDVFFVISGFLITGLLWREANSTGTVRLRNFYGARARRLLPASAFVGVVTMVVTAFLLPPLQARDVFGDGIASALYVSNYRFALQGVDYFSSQLPQSPFLHYWSLGVEEQFYLLWPTLILGTACLIRYVRRRTLTHATPSPRPYLAILMSVALASFALSLAITYWQPAISFFSLPTRAWQLALGGLVALTEEGWRRLSVRGATAIGAAGLAAIMLTCTFLNPATPYPWTAALLPTAGAALVIGAGCAAPTQWCGHLLGLAPMRAIGRISYSWYLWHWPVLILAPALVGHPLGLAARITTVLLSAGLAWLTLRYVENPFRFTPAIRESAMVSLGVGGAATGVTVIAGITLLIVVPTPVGYGKPASPLFVGVTDVPAGSSINTYDAAVSDAFTQVQAAVSASANLKAVPSNLSPPLNQAAAEGKTVLLNGCKPIGLQVERPECIAGDTASTTSVALVGDSNAAMWNPAFLHLANQRHWRLETLAKGACPMLDLPIQSPVLRREFTECEEWRDQMIIRLRAERPNLIVLSVMRRYGDANGFAVDFNSYDAAWLGGLNRLVRELRDTGAGVLVLGPIPDPQSSVPTCLSGHIDDARACSPLRSKAVNQAGIHAENAATVAAGGHYIDLTDLFCTADRCPVIVGNALVYLDQNHVTNQYSEALAPVMGALAARALAHG